MYGKGLEVRSEKNYISTIFGSRIQVSLKKYAPWSLDFGQNHELLHKTTKRFNNKHLFYEP